MTLFAILWSLHLWNTPVVFTDSAHIKENCPGMYDNRPDVTVYACYTVNGDVDRIVLDVDQQYLSAGDLLRHEFAHKVARKNSIPHIKWYFKDDEDMANQFVIYSKNPIMYSVTNPIEYQWFERYFNLLAL
jgi:hypothetical protein